MKTKLLIIALLVFFMAGMQNAQAQTKEETVDWLNTNGRILFDSQTKINDGEPYKETTFSFDKIVNDNVIFTEVTYVRLGNASRKDKSTYVYPLISILYQDVDSLTIEDYGNFLSVILELNGTYEQTEESNGKIQKLIREDRRFRIVTNYNDLKNVKRVLKAIMHLAKLSGAKENKQLF